MIENMLFQILKTLLVLMKILFQMSVCVRIYNIHMMFQNKSMFLCSVRGNLLRERDSDSLSTNDLIPAPLIKSQHN